MYGECPKDAAIQYGIQTVKHVYKLLNTIFNKALGVITL